MQQLPLAMPVWDQVVSVVVFLYSSAGQRRLEQQRQYAWQPSLTLVVAMGSEFDLRQRGQIGQCGPNPFECHGLFPAVSCICHILLLLQRLELDTSATLVLLVRMRVCTHVVRHNFGRSGQIQDDLLLRSKNSSRTKYMAADNISEENM